MPSPSRLACVSLLLVLAVATRAHADPNSDAKALMKQASADYDLGRFAEAASLYEQVYLLRPDVVDLLFNIAQSYRQAGNNEKAVFFYKRYLTKKPNAANAAVVQIQIEELERTIAAEKHARPAGPLAPAPVTPAPRPTPTPTVVAHRAPPPPPPPPAPVERKPAPTAIAPAAVAAATVPAAAPVATTPVATAPDEPAGHPVYKRWWFWGIVGVAVLGGAAAAYVALQPSSTTAFNPTLTPGEIGPASSHGLTGGSF